MNNGFNIVILLAIGIFLGAAVTVLLASAKSSTNARKISPEPTAKPEVPKPQVNLSWMSGFGVKLGDIARFDRMVVAEDKPVSLDQIDPGLAKSLRILQENGQVTGIEASRFVAGFDCLQPGKVLVFVGHKQMVHVDRVFVVDACKLEPLAAAVPA